MKKYIYICFLFLWAACQKEEILHYEQEKDGLQFNYEDMVIDYDFAMQKKTVMKENDYGQLVPTEVYLGDSISSDTISLFLSLMGHKSDINREFKLKAIPVEGQDSTKLLEIGFSPSYSFHAGQLRDTIRIALLRPASRGEFTIGITFDTDGTDALFELGATEQSIYRINVSDQYKEPEGWNLQMDYLGEYNEEKYAFFITILGKLYDPYGEDMHFNNLILRNALQAYNTEHPGKEKDFTFPRYAYPVWWGACGDYLGEYSEDKMEFMVEVLGQFQVWDDWGTNSRILREALEAYNAEHPDHPKGFTFPVNNKPPWWGAFDYLLGDYSDSKMEFMLEIVADIQPWAIETHLPKWKKALKEYNAAHPDAPKDFTFPDF